MKMSMFDYSSLPRYRVLAAYVVHPLLRETVVLPVHSKSDNQMTLEQHKLYDTERRVQHADNALLLQDDHHRVIPDRTNLYRKQY